MHAAVLIGLPGEDSKLSLAHSTMVFVTPFGPSCMTWSGLFMAMPRSVVRKTEPISRVEMKPTTSNYMHKLFIERI